MKLKKIKKRGRNKTAYPMVGSITDHLPNTIRILNKIHGDHLSRHEVIKGITEEFGASKIFSRKVIDFLDNVDLITIKNEYLILTDAAREYLETNDQKIILTKFFENIIGFEDFFHILRDTQPLKSDELMEKWVWKVSTGYPFVKSWKKGYANSQFLHRLNWLRSLGYIDSVSREYFLTEMGSKIIKELKQQEATTKDQKQEISHNDIEDKVKLIGEFFEFKAKKRESINAVLPTHIKLKEGDRQFDCLWVRYVHFGGKIQYPIEIQIGGNIADAISRLETVSNFVQKAIIVTDEKQEKIIMDRLRAKRSHLLDKLVFIYTEDIDKIVQAANILKSFTGKVFGNVQRQ